MPSKKEYTNGEITVTWKPEVCIHSANCAKGLPKVFDPKARPWINLENASSNEIMNTIKTCPSGALSFQKNGEEVMSISASSSTKIDIIPNGPIRVHGNAEITLSDGSVVEKETITALCRCGASSNKPYCDGTHKRIGWMED